MIQGGDRPPQVHGRHFDTFVWALFLYHSQSQQAGMIFASRVDHWLRRKCRRTDEDGDSRSRRVVVETVG